jgi:hypothetical protein
MGIPTIFAEVRGKKGGGVTYTRTSLYDIKCLKEKFCVLFIYGKEMFAV